MYTQYTWKLHSYIVQLEIIEKLNIYTEWKKKIRV